MKLYLVRKLPQGEPQDPTDFIEEIVGTYLFENMAQEYIDAQEDPSQYRIDMVDVEAGLQEQGNEGDYGC